MSFVHAVTGQKTQNDSPTNLPRPINNHTILKLSLSVDTFMFMFHFQFWVKWKIHTVAYLKIHFCLKMPTSFTHLIKKNKQNKHFILTFTTDGKFPFFRFTFPFFVTSFCWTVCLCFLAVSQLPAYELTYAWLNLIQHNGTVQLETPLIKYISTAPQTASKMVIKLKQHPLKILFKYILLESRP